MANLSNIVVPSNVLTATNTQTISNKTIPFSSNTFTGTLSAANGGTGLTSPGTTGNVLVSNGTTWTSATPAAGGSTLTAVASGSLSDGSKVIVNANGTVSVVAAVQQALGSPVVFQSQSTGDMFATYDAASQRVVIAYQVGSGGQAIVGTVSGTSISFGTTVNFAGAAGVAGGISATYDAASQRIVIAYNQSGGSSYQGAAIVGTVSGTSISFGSVVVFNYAYTFNISSAYDNSTQRVVIAYRNGGNGDYGTAIVGTVSGTSISFGSAVVFNSSTTENTSATYDAVSQRVVISYRNSGTFAGRAIVGTVSGTSISFGSAVDFAGASGLGDSSSLTYDAASQRVVIAYNNYSPSHGKAVIGTVSGTSISFGAPVAFNSADTGDISSAYDSSAQRVVISYRNGGISSYGTAIVGTVSGTSISFGTAVVFNSAATYATTAAYDSSTQRVVIAYPNNGGNSGFGTAIVFRNFGTNLTAENFIGISNAAYTDGQTATIQLVGAVDDAQSGLTAGQSYFVQGDGTLGLTPAATSVFAGTAVSATKIIVKG